MNTRRPAKTLDYLVLGIIPMLASITPIAVGAAAACIPGILGGAIRFTVAGVGLLVLLAATGQLKPIARGDWLRVALLGLAAVPINQYAFFNGVHLSNSSHGGIIYAATPVVVTVAMCLLKVERWTLAAVSGAVLAVAGVMVIMTQTLHTTGSTYWQGDALLLLAVATWSFYLVVSRPLTLRYGSLSAQAWVFVAGAAMSLPLVFGDAVALPWAKIPWTAWAGMGYLTVVVAGVLFFLFNWAMVRQPPSRVATFANAAPPLTLLWNALAHQGYLSAWFLVGSTLLLAGMICALRKAKVVAVAEEGPVMDCALPAANQENRAGD